MSSSTPMISFDEEKGYLNIVCDLKVEGQPSSSGKTVVLCSTRGNIRFALPDGRTIFVGLNVYRSPDQEEQG